MKNLLLLVLLSFTLFANDTQNLESDFLNSLEEVSEIATKTKLNIDDTPSFVTVLHSDKLMKLGVDNVFEALGLVPGVQLKKEATGVPIVIFRGVIQKSEVKLMVDGVTINNSYRGSMYYYLDFPIELVKRIEVIRGAGSVLYGSGAISGVINIITKSSEKTFKNKAFLSAGTYNSTKGGAIFSSDIGETKISFDGYYQKNNKKIYVKPNPSGYFGDSDRHLNDYSLGVNVRNGNLSFLSRIKKSNIGNAYGVLCVLDTDNNQKSDSNRFISSQISYRNNFNKQNRYSILAGYTNYKQEVDIEHNTTGVIDTKFAERSYYTELNFISTSLDNNELLIGGRYESAKTLKSQWSALKPYISNPNLSRGVTAIYLNDTYNLNSDIDISAGIRYDNYSDYGSSSSPNLGIVYRYNDKLSFKALYSHSFRAPSWIELTSNSELEAESSKSIETGLIYKPNFQNLLRINFYKSVIKDMIKKNKAREYVQDTKNNFYGAELEYLYTPSSQVEMNFFASYINAKDHYKNDLPGVANIIASTTFNYKIGSSITLGSILKYVSKPEQPNGDKMDDSITFDQSISYYFKDITTSLVIKDFFNAGTYYALPKNDMNKYDQDFDDGGRKILIKLSMEF